MPDDFRIAVSGIGVIMATTYFMPRNLWSGHEQTQPKSVERTS
jgi:hypothetical protein